LSSTTSTQPSGNHTTYTYTNVLDTANGTKTSWDSQSKKATVLKQLTQEQRHGCWQTEAGTMKQFYPPAPSDKTSPQNNATGKTSASRVTPPYQTHTPQTVQEDLGTTTIQGLEVNGTRYMTTTPVGEIGNDQPLVVTAERWFSKTLGIQVRGVNDDPQRGKETTEMVKLDQSEPDPALFQPPDGYEIVTEEMVPCKDQPVSAQ
jgi:hypothetical protein